jgi:hypothetical protein
VELGEEALLREELCLVAQPSFCHDQIWSARRMVERRWAMMKVVRPATAVRASIEARCESTRRFVHEDEHGRRLQEGPRNGDALTLASGQPRSPTWLE